MKYKELWPKVKLESPADGKSGEYKLRDSNPIWGC